jgi:hypothetical protein
MNEKEIAIKVTAEDESWLVSSFETCFDIETMFSKDQLKEMANIYDNLLSIKLKVNK